MATRRLLQAASRRLRAGARSASDDARIVERATRGQVEMRQFGIESLGGAGMHAPHVAIFGAGFVGVNTALWRKPNSPVDFHTGSRTTRASSSRTCRKGPSSARARS